MTTTATEASPSATPTPTPGLKPAYRWLVMGAVSLVCLAQYYIYDSITPLAAMIKQQLHYSNAEYGLLFSAYGVANVFLLMLLFAGVIVDRVGLKRSGILFSFLCVLGAGLTALGAMHGLSRPPGAVAHPLIGGWSSDLVIMLVGRTIFGVGAEAILVVNNKVLARWFTGKELAFAFGLNLTLMRLGTFLALNTQAPVASSWGLQGSLWFAVVVMSLGFLGFFLYLGLERLVRGRPGAPAEEKKGGAEDEFHWREAFRFDASFWLITLLCVTFYSAVFPFQSYAPDILAQKFGYSASKAGSFTSALTVGTMIFTPLFGFFVDRRGKRATLMALGALLLIPCHLLLGYTRFPPVVPIFLVGVSLSLVPAALWAAIPMMVPEKRLGTAFGVIGYVQNVGLTLFPYLAGKIADAHTTHVVKNGKTVDVVDYTSTMLMFAALGIVGFVFALALKRVDRRRPVGESIERVMRA